MPVISGHKFKVADKHATRFTIKLIGKAIKDGSQYLPIRNYAAALATRAAPKDYKGQLEEVYNDFVSRWRYVRDPDGLETVTTGPEALFNLILGHNGGLGQGYGGGDCSNAAAALGAALKSIGFPIQLVTIAPPEHKKGAHFTHVFLRTEIPGKGIVFVDPVLYPEKQLGSIAPHSRLAIWDLNGQIVAFRGMNPKLFNKAYGKGGKRR